MVRSSRVQIELAHRNQSRQLEMGCTQRIAQFQVDNNSMKHMEMALAQLSMSLLMVRSSKDRFLGHSSMIPKQLEMVHSQHIHQFLVDIDSMR